jgi:hypothetical protein
MQEIHKEQLAFEAIEFLYFSHMNVILDLDSDQCECTIVHYNGCRYRFGAVRLRRHFKILRSSGIDSKESIRLAGRDDKKNPIPARFLAPIYCSKIRALVFTVGMHFIIYCLYLSFCV